MTAAVQSDTRALAETYDRVSGRQFQFGEDLAERLRIEPGMHVLDVGCGTGRLARWLAERVGAEGRVVGIDPSSDRVEVARSRGGPVHYDVAPAEDLGAFAGASFDVVSMTSVLHWVRDKPKAMSEVRRVLRKGGRVGATTFPDELGSAGTVARVIEPLLASPRYAPHVDIASLPFGKRRYTTTDLIKLVLESGLELEELHVIPRVYVHRTAEDLVQFLEASSFGNFLRIIAAEHRPALRADFVLGLEAMRGHDVIEARDWGVLFVASRV